MRTRLLFLICKKVPCGPARSCPGSLRCRLCSYHFYGEVLPSIPWAKFQFFSSYSPICRVSLDLDPDSYSSQFLNPWAGPDHCSCLVSTTCELPANSLQSTCSSEFRVLSWDKGSVNMVTVEWRLELRRHF